MTRWCATARARATSRCSSWTSITSRRATTRSATPPATISSWKWRGGRWEICDEAMRERVASRARMQRDLRSALDRQELSADYQPVADLVTGELRGFEVLLRWRGLLLPLDFLVAAEAAGGILRIETWLLREA